MGDENIKKMQETKSIPIIFGFFFVVSFPQPFAQPAPSPRPIQQRRQERGDTSRAGRSGGWTRRAWVKIVTFYLFFTCLCNSPLAFSPSCAAGHVLPGIFGQYRHRFNKTHTHTMGDPARNLERKKYLRRKGTYVNRYPGPTSCPTPRCLGAMRGPMPPGTYVTRKRQTSSSAATTQTRRCAVAAGLLL